jgi:hypothetical protein
VGESERGDASPPHILPPRHSTRVHAPLRLFTLPYLSPTSFPSRDASREKRATNRKKRVESVKGEEMPRLPRFSFLATRSLASPFPTHSMRSAIALRLLCFAIALLCDCVAIALLCDCFVIAIALRLLCECFAIALQLCCDCFAL